MESENYDSPLSVNRRPPDIEDYLDMVGGKKRGSSGRRLEPW